MLYYGVAYYPEFRTPEQIQRDLVLLKEAGMNAIRIGEFLWCEFEPEEGVFRFEWLESIVEQAARLGIWTVLCTPTAAPPVWLMERHPEMRYENNDGFRRPFGGRRHYCYNSPVYREYSYRIAAEMARRFKDNPRVIGYQIDNELAQEGTGRCRCSVCRKAFQDWLEQKYATIESLNERWGTLFWGQRYSRFDQIQPPVATIEPCTTKPIEAYFDNPSLRLDFERFCSRSLIDYQQVQVEALRRHAGKHQAVTTNGTGSATCSIDYYEAFGNLDRYGVDTYPNLRGRGLPDASFEWALGRGIGTGGASPGFWVLELACGGGHALWGHEGRLQPYPGSIRQLAVHAFAGGAELVAHFQYIQFTHGAEQLNHSILDADGVPRRRYEEVKEAAGDIRKLEQLLEHSSVGCDTAILFDYDALWALKIKPVHKEMSFLSHAKDWYARLQRLGIGADIISARADFSAYSLIIVPALFIADSEVKEKLMRYASAGGTVIATFLTAVKNTDNAASYETLPVGLTDFFGVHVTEWEPVYEGSAARIAVDLGGGAEPLSSGNRFWTECLEPHGGELVGVYADTFRKGQGVISRNGYGQGTVYYFGTVLEFEASLPLLAHIAETAGVRRAPFLLPDGVEAVRREGTDGTVWFLFNADASPAAIGLEAMYRNVLNGHDVQGTLELPPKGYIVLKRG